jgi:hypothetical protein
MSRVLIAVGAMLNFLFGLFHIWLFWHIHRSANIAAGTKGLILALNVGGTLLIFFVAIASAFYAREILTTGIGRLVLLLGALLYLSRAAEEFVWFRFSPVIFFSCLLVGLIYTVLLFMRTDQDKPLTER